MLGVSGCNRAMWVKTRRRSWGVRSVSGAGRWGEERVEGRSTKTVYGRTLRKPMLVKLIKN